jgi:hypothetical protein
VYAGPALNPPGPLIPWANPANIAFDDQDGTLLVTNHASLVAFDPSLFVVFNVVVNDKGRRCPSRSRRRTGDHADQWPSSARVSSIS